MLIWTLPALKTLLRPCLPSAIISSGGFCGFSIFGFCVFVKQKLNFMQILLLDWLLRTLPRRELIISTRKEARWMSGLRAGWKVSASAGRIGSNPGGATVSTHIHRASLSRVWSLSRLVRAVSVDCCSSLSWLPSAGYQRANRVAAYQW